MEKSTKNQEDKRDGVISDNIPRWLLISLFLIPVMIYLPGILGKIPYPSESSIYTDLMLTHYPNALYLQRSIIEFRQIPLWSTLIHSGAPFAANPLAGLFYLPGWLALLLPLPGGISVILAAHAVFASWGMYLFLKNENVGNLGSIAGGLIFGLTPKIAAHYGAGHVSLIYSISWTPWLFLVSKKDQQGWKTGMTAALLFLADPRWSVYAGIFWFSYDFAHRHNLKTKVVLSYYLKASVTALLIASPLIIPLYEYIGLSTRPRMGLEDVLTFSLSPEKILGLIIPGNWGNPEWYFYSGGIVLGLYLIQLFIGEIRFRNRFWITWIFISILISFGSWFIDPEMVVQIPIISLLRVPARALFLLGFSFSMIAAKTVDYLLNDLKEIKIVRKTAFGIALLSAGLALPIVYLLSELSIALIWGFGFLVIFALILLIKEPGKTNDIWGWLIVGLVVIDLLGAGFMSYYLKDSKQSEYSDILSLINVDSETFRIYSPSFSFPQQFTADFEISLADGVDPMQVAAYADFMERATGIDNKGYSVTIPPFESGNPDIDNIDSVPDAFLLSLLNVKYVISEFELNNPDFQDHFVDEHNFIYLNVIGSQRAWVEEEPKNNRNYQGFDYGNINGLSLSPNKISLSASGPGNLVLSEVYYPGWMVFVDGQKQPVEKAYGVLRSVNLPDGEHHVEFVFQPITVFVGVGLAVLGWTLSAWQIYKNENDDRLLQ